MPILLGSVSRGSADSQDLRRLPGGAGPGGRRDAAVRRAAARDGRSVGGRRLVPPGCGRSAAGGLVERVPGPQYPKPGLVREAQS